MKKKISLPLWALVLCVGLMTGCGKEAKVSKTDTSAKVTAESTTAEEPGDKESVHPYAWLGYQEMPVCPYLDGLTNGVYYVEKDTYSIINDKLYTSHTINAVDGANGYTYDYNKGVMIDGKMYSLNEENKTYVLIDMSKSIQDQLKQNKQLREEGKDLTNKKLVGTGTATIPLYCDEVDNSKYEYYEFYSDAIVPTTERFFFKDGDVFAVYSKIKSEDSEYATTEVITKFNLTPDSSLFTLPEDFDQYTEQKIGE